MELWSLGEIKKLRKRFNLSQKELAQRAGVSQSLIAKIEAGTLDPTYTKAQKILNSLKEIHQKKEIKARDIMNTKMMFVKPQDLVKNVIKQMKKHGISQMPVKKKNQINGLITEGILLKNIADHLEKLETLKVEDVMDDAPPIISLNSGLKTLLSLLQEYPIVLVAEKGDVKGLISKSDLLGKI